MPSDEVIESTWATVEDNRMDGRLQLRFDLLPDGSFVLRQLLFESHGAITSALLASLPLQEVLRSITAPTDPQEAEQRLQQARSLRALMRRMGLSDREVDVLERGAPQRQAPRTGREGPTFEELEYFAAQHHLSSTVNPKRAIAMTMDTLKRHGIVISRATANRWRTLAQHTDPPLLPGAKPPLRPSAGQGPEDGASDD